MTALAVHPVDPPSRLMVLDALRGFSLGGILAVNLFIFAFPMQMSFGRPWPQWPDAWVYGVMAFLALGKFYALFSLLFGAGFMLQREHLTLQGDESLAVPLRRLAGLLGFGLLHGLLIWHGDILTLYAILGFFLLLFRRRMSRTLLIWGLVLPALCVLLMALFAGVSWLGTLTPQGARAIFRVQAEMDAETARAIAESLRIQAGGTFLEILRLRAGTFGQLLAQGLFIAPQVLGLFLLGAWAAQTDLARDPAAHAPMLRRLVGLALLLGVPATALFLALTAHHPPGPAHPVGLLGWAIQFLAAPLLALGLASALLLLWSQGRAMGLARRLAPLGRCALSAYLLQSLLATSLFDAWGLGLFGKVRPLLLPLIWAAIYGLELWLAPLWFRRFRYGPAEWLWRTLTYGRRQPFRA